MNPLEQLVRMSFFGPKFLPRQAQPSMPPAQAMMPPAELPEMTDSDVESSYKMLPFYPSERHVKHNLAPEKSLDEWTLGEIAKTRRRAEETGVLTPELGEHLLPIAMVEGRGAGMGVKGGQNFYASRRFQEALDKMELKEGKDYVTNFIKGEKHIQPIEEDGNGPRLAAAILGEKAAVARSQGDHSVEGAIKRYNGKGKGLEDMGYGELVPANVDTYLKKIQEARKLLSHPLNTDFINFFKKAYGR